MTTPLGALDGRPDATRAASRSPADARDRRHASRSASTAPAHAAIATGIGFYDHLLDVARPPRPVRPGRSRRAATSQVDEHHTVEDVALVLGAAFAEALGDRAGIRRFGDARVPMDESLATAVIDVGGRPYAVIDLPFRGERVGELPLQLVEHALEAFARTAGATLHLTRHAAATTITSPRPRSRRWAGRCASRASSIRAATGVASTKGDARMSARRRAAGLGSPSSTTAPATS